MTLRAPTGLDSLAASADGPVSGSIRTLLRRRIIEMEIAPGDPISEKALSLECGVSRTPVRDALQRLAEEKLVAIYPQRGTFVSRIDLGAVRDALVIRQALERVTVRTAAGRVTPAGVSDLQNLLDLQALHDRADALQPFHQADDAFHAAIAGIAGHANVWRVVKTEKAHVERCRVLAVPVSERRRTVMTQHAKIFRAIAAGDPDAAEAAMAEHLADVLPNLSDLRRRFPGYFLD